MCRTMCGRLCRVSVFDFLKPYLFTSSSISEAPDHRTGAATHNPEVAG
jgi:hypothetical protein